jgi:lysophospholipase L1-like esterase
VTTTYILVGDSQGVGIQSYLSRALARADIVELGAAVRVGVSTQRQIEGRGPVTTEERSAGASGTSPLDPTAAALAALNPNFVIVVLGGNDHESESTYTGTLRTLVQILRPANEGRARPIIWVGPVFPRPAPHPAGFYQTVSNRRRTRQAADAVQERVRVNKERIAGIQQRVLATLDVVWLDGFAITRDLEHRDDGLHLRAPARRTFAERVARSVRSLNLPASPPPPTGSHVASLAQAASNERVHNNTRATQMQATLRTGMYDSANINQSARQTAIASQEARYTDSGSRQLRVPVVTNALGFDFPTGLWINRSSTNATTETETPTPIVTRVVETGRRIIQTAVNTVTGESAEDAVDDPPAVEGDS